MASFSAELHVAGTTYPVRHCTYEFTQATSERGRVVAKVRHGLVHLTLDVPDDDQLLDWAATPYKPLAGRVSFYDAKGGPVLETLAWEAGQCVGYQEEFSSGDQNQGAYVCHLTIAAPTLTLQSGGPAAYVAPAAGEHGTPASAAATVLAAAKLKAEEAATGLIKKVITPAGEVGTEILGVGLATIARTASLTLGLLLTPTNSRDDPGYASEWELYRRNHAQFTPLTPDQLRLAQLEHLHEQGALTTQEEAELIALLAKIKGIRVNRLTDLADANAATFPLKKLHVPLRNFTYLHDFAYTKRPTVDKDALRRKFDSSGRSAFLKHLASDPAKMDRMKKLGLADEDLEAIRDGFCPDGYQVHHKLSLDDGGDNSFANLVLIKDDPYHRAITAYQNNSTRGLKPGATKVLDWPTVNDYIYPNY